MTKLDGIGCAAATPLVLTGHSLGGGLSTVASLGLKRGYNRNVMANVQFEAPSQGNSAYRDAINGVAGIPVTRITNNQDLAVQAFPNATTFPHYDFPHPGVEVYYSGATREDCAAPARNCPLRLWTHGA